MLISLDDQRVSVIKDIRIALFYKQSGETIKVKAQRGAEGAGVQRQVAMMG